eukprot:TRINITY_DN67994_c0_g1_i1.p1 TRINITY_DN67994_c0_g1~~TRINITY_DN67994_c0_g1_i1.p1  ORF type:complete len:347 (+),score=48.35 TRINITY_DN67994_c0_g1_i1:146-1042(+)
MPAGYGAKGPVHPQQPTALHATLQTLRGVRSVHGLDSSYCLPMQSLPPTYADQWDSACVTSACLSRSSVALPGGWPHEMPLSSASGAQSPLHPPGPDYGGSCCQRDLDARHHGMQQRSQFHYDRRHPDHGQDRRGVAICSSQFSGRNGFDTGLGCGGPPLSSHSLGSAQVVHQSAAASHFGATPPVIRPTIELPPFRIAASSKQVNMVNSRSPQEAASGTAERHQRVGVPPRRELTNQFKDSSSYLASPAATERPRDYESGGEMSDSDNDGFPQRRGRSKRDPETSCIRCVMPCLVTC